MRAIAELSGASVPNSPASPPEDAPADNPHESLPLCGVLGIAAIGAVTPAFTQMALDQLQDASFDPRQRVREAVALGVRDLLTARQNETVAGLEGVG